MMICAICGQELHTGVLTTEGDLAICGSADACNINTQLFPVEPKWIGAVDSPKVRLLMPEGYGSPTRRVHNED
jgi:alpha-tubulin suppressor-like RCC1 family protein